MLGNYFFSVSWAPVYIYIARVWVCLDLSARVGSEWTVTVLIYPGVAWFAAELRDSIYARREKLRGRQGSVTYNTR